MENKKIYTKRLGTFNKETAPEPILKAPPPTPSSLPKPRSGSVPDVRVKEKLNGNTSHHRGLTQTVSCSNKSIQKVTADFERKRSTSEHAMVTGYAKAGPLAALGMSLCTSNLLHSVRQRLLNL